MNRSPARWLCGGHFVTCSDWKERRNALLDRWPVASLTCRAGSVPCWGGCREPSTECCARGYSHFLRKQFLHTTSRQYQSSSGRNATQRERRLLHEREFESESVSPGNFDGTGPRCRLCNRRWHHTENSRRHYTENRNSSYNAEGGHRSGNRTVGARNSRPASLDRKRVPAGGHGTRRVETMR